MVDGALYPDVDAAVSKAANPQHTPTSVALSGSGPKAPLSTDSNDSPTFRNRVQTNELDSRSIFVSNIKWCTGPDLLEASFAEFGPIEKVTVLIAKHTGLSKGQAYIAFGNADSSKSALRKDGFLLQGREIRVQPKYTFENPPPRKGRGRRGKGRKS